MVCAVHAQRVVVVVHRDVGMTAERLFDGNRHPAAAGKEVDDQLILHAEQKLLMGTISHWLSPPAPRAGTCRGCARQSACRPRSEEHTTELQSLMRISYAVFCLKKKITPHNTTA